MLTRVLTCIPLSDLKSAVEWVSPGTQLGSGVTPGKAKQKQKDGMAIYGQMAKHGYKGLRNPVRTPNTAQLVVQ